MTDAKNFLTTYTKDLNRLLSNIDSDNFTKIATHISNYHNQKSKIYIIGNGGSAATASHMANDLGIGLKRKGILNLNIESLADNHSVITAIANDTGYDNIFYLQLKDILKVEDTLVAISCSGNSTNIIKACDYAKNIGAKLIALCGFDGGKLKTISDLNFHVMTQAGAYALVEDIHMIFNHMLWSFYMQERNSFG